MTARRQLSPQEAVQEAEGRQWRPGGTWRPRTILQWREVGYISAMHVIIDVIEEAAGRPGATGRDVATAVADVAEAVLEMYYHPEQEWLTAGGSGQ